MEWNPKNVGQTTTAAAVFGRPRDGLWWNRETGSAANDQAISSSVSQLLFSLIVWLKLIENDLKFDATLSISCNRLPIFSVEAFQQENKHRSQHPIWGKAMWILDRASTTVYQGKIVVIFWARCRIQSCHCLFTIAWRVAFRQMSLITAAIKRLMARGRGNALKMTAAGLLLLHDRTETKFLHELTTALLPLISQLTPPIQISLQFPPPFQSSPPFPLEAQHFLWSTRAWEINNNCVYATYEATHKMALDKGTEVSKEGIHVGNIMIWP